MKKIVLYGYGFVGKGFDAMIGKRYSVTVVDPTFPSLSDEERAMLTVDGQDRRYVASTADLGDETFDMAIVSVPTNTDPETGANDMSIVEQVVREAPTDYVLIKSTLRIGTTDKLIAETGKKIAMSPEFMGEGNYYDPYGFATDMLKTGFMICGGEVETVNYIYDILVPILGPSYVYHRTTAKEAEIIKLMENTYFGFKNAFSQMMWGVCQAYGADYYRVREGWALDPRVDKLHTAVFPEKRGFSGKCLPKDLNTLVVDGQAAGADMEPLKEVLRFNSRIREDEPVRFKS